MAEDGSEERLKGHFRGSYGKTSEGSSERHAGQFNEVMEGWPFAKGQAGGLGMGWFLERCWGLIWNGLIGGCWHWVLDGQLG